MELLEVFSGLYPVQAVICRMSRLHCVGFVGLLGPETNLDDRY